MELSNLNVGFAITGSFCTFSQIPPILKELKELGVNLIPIMSQNAKIVDTRFTKAADFVDTVRKITGREPISDLQTAEPIGPKELLDILIIAPCTGNTLAKIANGITDTPVTLACKAHLRNKRPVVIAVSTNDALAANAKNLGILLGMKYVYFVPFSQDDPIKKSNSLVAHMNLIVPTMIEALNGNQIQPLILG